MQGKADNEPVFDQLFQQGSKKNGCLLLTAVYIFIYLIRMPLSAHQIFSVEDILRLYPDRSLHNRSAVWP